MHIIVHHKPRKWHTAAKKIRTRWFGSLIWWTITDSNRWPCARQAHALPAELIVHGNHDGPDNMEIIQYQSEFVKPYFHICQSGISKLWNLPQWSIHSVHWKIESLFSYPSPSAFSVPNADDRQGILAERIASFQKKERKSFKKLLTFRRNNARMDRPHWRGLSWCAQMPTPLERDYKMK